MIWTLHSNGSGPLTQMDVFCSMTCCTFAGRIEPHQARMANSLCELSKLIGCMAQGCLVHEVFSIFYRQC